jgi:hypothetical protein
LGKSFQHLGKNSTNTYKKKSSSNRYRIDRKFGIFNQVQSISPHFTDVFLKQTPWLHVDRHAMFLGRPAAHGNCRGGGVEDLNPREPKRSGVARVQRPETNGDFSLW